MNSPSTSVTLINGIEGVKVRILHEETLLIRSLLQQYKPYMGERGQ